MSVKSQYIQMEHTIVPDPRSRPILKILPWIFSRKAGYD